MDLNETSDLLRRRSNTNQQETTDKFKKLKIYICTWNVSTKQPCFGLDKLLKLDSFDEQNLPDIYVVGFQEINSKPLQYLFDIIFNDPWTNELSKQLSKYDYIRLTTTRLVGILLNIYVKKSLVPYIRQSTIDWIRLGFFGLWGNKGANICSLNIGTFQMCFINSHLSAHEHNYSKRHEEYKKIVDKDVDLMYTTKKIINHSYIFFFGDLNYRLHNLDMDTIKQKIINKEYESLLKYDQRRLSLKNGDDLKSFIEGDIKFPPTYKYDIDTDNFDTSKKNRKPAYCDRIFFKADPKNFAKCEVKDYNSLPAFKTSDHKPVYGLYYINVLSWESLGPLVKFTRMKGNKNNDLEIEYSINQDLITDSRDWIGLYAPEMKCSSEYITYVWPERIKELEDIKIPRLPLEVKKYFQKTIIISNAYLNSGKYVVAYFSQKQNHLVGISESFDIKVNWI